VPIGSIVTDDLRAELTRHHEGEDSRITIECQCERRYNLKGHNLKRDFGSLASAKEAHVPRAAYTPGSPRATGGCMALAPHLHTVV
jgi:hypothetical protein